MIFVRDVYQAGTLSGNPIAVAAGNMTLNLINTPNFYEKLSEQTQKLIVGLQEHAISSGIEFSADAVGSMFGLYFNKKIPTCFVESSKCNLQAFKYFFHAMLDRGIYFAPSIFEAGFVSSMHNNDIINITLDAAKEVFHKMKQIQF